MERTELTRIVRHLWGEEPAEVETLVGERDLNVRIVDPEGRWSVLKVMHVGADPDRIDLQAAVLGQVTESSPEIPVPEVIPTPAGEAWTRWQSDAGQERLVWRVGWCPGRLLADGALRPPALLGELGATLARFQMAVAAVDHPGLHKLHEWDLTRADSVLGRPSAIPDGGRRGWVEAIADDFVERLKPALDELASVPIHGDANDHNVLVSSTWEGGELRQGITGLLDLGDMVRAPAICDVAIAGAYAMMDQPDPVGVVAEIAAGFHRVRPLEAREVELLLPLVRARLGVSVVKSAERAALAPAGDYLFVSEEPAWRLLESLRAVPDAVARLRILQACGIDASDPGSRLEAWLEEAHESFHPLLDESWREETPLVLDFAWGSSLLGADPAKVACDELDRTIEEAMAEAGTRLAIGRWNEPRSIYRAEHFQMGPHPVDGSRTVHLGIDVWVPAGTPLHAPVAGVVESLGELPGDGDYGPTLLLRHDPEAGLRFWTLWGHLDPDVLERWSVGDAVAAGAVVARVGAPPRNGNWPPHLHLQLVSESLPGGHDLPGVVWAGEGEAWKRLFPNPARLAGLAPGSVDAEEEARRAGRDVDQLRTRRSSVLGGNLSLSYRTPLHIVAGWRQFLHDDTGRPYLDLYNNVPHVGHQHPRVVEAVRRQSALLNTNTRYLHDTLLRYAEALVDRLPEGLEVAYLVNSASEANELALRMARAATGRRETLVLEGAYHGHSISLIQISPYKFHGPGGEGREPWVEVLDLPDLYRGRYRREDADAASRYVSDARRRVERMVAEGRPPAAFIAESLPSVGGQIVLPDGYLSGVYEAVRSAGGVCIADEVQVGFGRLGSVEWGFELQGVVPDVVVLGKPVGNGFPLGVVVASRAVAEAFDNGMEFFATFGGNPVAAAAGLAVLEVLDREGLRNHAGAVGERLTEVLRGAAARHPCVGDVRGMGLFQGIELVRDPETRTPAPEVARHLANRLAESGVLTGTDGVDHNVLKLRGPMVVEEEDVIRFGEILDGELSELPG